MKEEGYVMKLMATYGALRPIDGGLTQRSVTRRSGICENVSFVYTEPFSNHIKVRHQVDDLNNARHSPISLEESVNTNDWIIRVFTFILAVVVVNFRQLLAEELMDFSFAVNAGNKKRSRRSMESVASVCGVETAPVYAGSWPGTQWQFLTSKYPQHICKTAGCKKRIRTFCKCMIGLWMCPACIGMHIAQIAEAS